jgi:hypothetical protein
MDDPPTNDPMDIADRYATVSRKMVDDAAQVAIDAFNKINSSGSNAPSYTAGDAIRSMTKLANIAITGGSALARIPLQIRPKSEQIPPKSDPMLVADQVATVIARGLADATAVASDAAEKIDAGTFRNQWVDSAITLTGMATLRAAEVAEAIGAGPGVLANPRVRFGPFKIDIANTTDELILKIAKLSRPDVDENIADLVRFEPAGGVLKADVARKFSLAIDSTGVPSGVFRGEVKVFKKGGTRPIKSVPVTVNL